MISARPKNEGESTLLYGTYHMLFVELIAAEPSEQSKNECNACLKGPMT